MRRIVVHLSIGILMVCVALAMQGCPCPPEDEEPTAEMAAMGETDALTGEDIALTDPPEEVIYIEPTTPEFENIYFEFDQYRIRGADEMSLGRIASYLREHQDVRVMIEGHCDERGTNEYNMALGEQRALAARRYLIGLGVTAARLSTISYGEEPPSDDGSSEQAWATNRRDEFTVSQ